MRMIHFESTVEIARPVTEVFDYVADPARMAEWNSAGASVRPLEGAGERYRMERQLPTGAATNELEIAARAPRELTLRTISGPTPFVYHYVFEPTSAGTRIALSAEVELRGIAKILGLLAAQGVKRGVDANFETLRATLEERPGT
jgi:uncharacterized protein YndB with AHSA1/START domain